MAKNMYNQIFLEVGSNRVFIARGSTGAVYFKRPVTPSSLERISGLTYTYHETHYMPSGNTGYVVIGRRMRMKFDV